MSEEDSPPIGHKAKDFATEVADALSKLVLLDAPDFNLERSLQELLQLEKRCRLGADALSTSKVALAALDLLHSTRSWTRLNETILALSKKRAQLQRVQEDMIERGASYLEESGSGSGVDEQTQRGLIETLRTVSAGKMFVELVRARLTRRLAKMEEGNGEVAKAAELMQEVQVETIGAMDIKEKIDFLLEQIRLCLGKRDYVRAEIIAKKVDTKALKVHDLQAERIRFYTLMIEYHTHFGRYQNIAEAYYALYTTPSVMADSILAASYLQKLVLFSLLAPFDSEISDIIARIRTEKQLETLPVLSALLQSYTENEVMSWPLEAAQLSLVEADSAFGSAAAAQDAGWTLATKQTQAITVHDRRQRWRDLRTRIVQHNLRVIALYYDQIRVSRIAALLGLSVPEVEAALSELVTSGQLYAKIDRPVGIVSFVKAATSEIEIIDDYSSRIDSLHKLVDETCQMIAKEMMVAGTSFK